MILRPFFSYFGSKYRIVPNYYRPKYDTIIEPFAGSACYSLYYPEKKVILYDINPIIYSVWDYLIKVSEKEILELPSEITDLRLTDLTEEQKYLIGFNLNSATTCPKHVPSPWAKSCNDLNFWNEGKKKLIANQLKYIRHWTAHNTSYETIPNIQATWFIDPPYIKAGRLYPYSNINYLHLSKYCKSRQGQIIVCEQLGARWLHFNNLAFANSLQSKHGKKLSKEVFWSNESLFA